MRADMLPYAYCAELAKMLDQAAPIRTKEAIEIIERNLGRPVDDVFEAIDPAPIGSASLACVYQARLKTGELVAVKVRRPGIGPLIAADLCALDWLLIAGETLTFVGPGVARRFRDDFQTILFNELDFRAEARYTDIFRRRAAKRKKDVTAPRVYFQYCTEEVMVSELVSGVWMWELLAAVDTNDRQFLARVRRQGIEPKALASKLVKIMNREVQEELFFHADPHPANLIILPNNKICFIDFGAIGRFSTQTRKLFRELAYHSAQGDIGRIVNTSMSLLGPLPPMDIEHVREEMEKIYASTVYAMHSKDAEWWEKSSAQGWLRSMEIARRFQLPATFETLLFFRTTFSYDTIIHRLNREINVVKECRQGMAGLPKRARQGSTQTCESWLQAAPSRSHRHGLLANGGGRRHVYVVLFPIAAKCRDSDLPLQEHCRKNLIHCISVSEAGISYCHWNHHRRHQRQCFKEMVGLRDRLGCNSRTCDHLRLGSTDPNCSCPGRDPQDCNPFEPARYQAFS
jgi:ubiquinone biosynthesis protein